MAERRMFAKTIIDSDAFLDMPLSTQCLYFHLSMRADDDGFLNNAKKIQRILGCAEDDFKILLSKNFLIPFENGVCVIKHWRIHNYIQKDRYKPTMYEDLRDKLYLKNNDVYTMDTECIQDVDSLDAQVRLGKVREGKGRLLEDNKNIQPRALLEAENIPKNIINDFMAIRKAKKLPLTKSALDGIKREAEKLNFTLLQALEQCCTESWAGFKAEWVLNKNKQVNAPPDKSAFQQSTTDLAYEKLFGSMPIEKEVHDATIRI